MKDCYLFSDEEGIWVQGKRKLVFIHNPIVTTDSNQEVVKIRDADTGKYYYPVSDCRKIHILKHMITKLLVPVFNA
jgi:hypothetical protein